MWLGKRGDVSDGCIWVCPQCKTTKSIREESFFYKVQDASEEVVGCASTLQRMPLKRQRWTLTQLVTSTGTFLEVRLEMSIILCYVYRWFRETTLLNKTILLGGPGKIVKVDESLFRRKPKVKLNLIIILHF